MPNRAGLLVGLTFVAALVVALLTRGNGIAGIVVLFLVFVPIEKLFALQPQRVFREGFWTDLTHLLANNLLAVGVPIVFFGGYWGHRLSHTVPFLWRFHAVHDRAVHPRQRAPALSRPGLGDQHPRVAPLAPRARPRGARHPCRERRGGGRERQPGFRPSTMNPWISRNVPTAGRSAGLEREVSGAVPPVADTG